jgi:hypothetical protein
VIEMTATEITALDPRAAAHVRRLAQASTADLLAAHGVTDPAAVLTAIAAQVSDVLHPIAA